MAEKGLGMGQTKSIFPSLSGAEPGFLPLTHTLTKHLEVDIAEVWAREVRRERGHYVDYLVVKKYS